MKYENPTMANITTGKDPGPARKNDVCADDTENTEEQKTQNKYLYIEMETWNANKRNRKRGLIWGF